MFQYKNICCPPPPPSSSPSQTFSTENGRKLPPRSEMCHALFVSAFMFFPRVFQGGSGRRNRMRSRRLDGLKGKGADPPNSSPSPPSISLQRRLIAVGCGANSESKAAGALARAGGCPLAGVNGSGVEWVGGRVCGCRKIKELSSPDVSQFGKQGSETAATLPKCGAIFLCAYFFLRFENHRAKGHRSFSQPG